MYHFVTLSKNLKITVLCLFQKVLFVGARIECTWYREVYPKLMISIRGCSKVFGRVPLSIFVARGAQFFQNGVFPRKFNSKCSDRHV